MFWNFEQKLGAKHRYFDVYSCTVVYPAFNQNLRRYEPGMCPFADIPPNDMDSDV